MNLECNWRMKKKSEINDKRNNAIFLHALIICRLNVGNNLLMRISLHVVLTGAP